MEKVLRWRGACKQAGKISGYHLQECKDEADCIRKVVDYILPKVISPISESLKTKKVESLWIPKGYLFEDDHVNHSIVFKRMQSLQVLILENGTIFWKNTVTCLPSSLCFIEWPDYHSSSLPEGFEPSHLVSLRLYRSWLVELWPISKKLSNLKHLDLSNSLGLTKTPDFEICGDMRRLSTLMVGSPWIRSLPPSLSGLTDLKLSGCEVLESIPDTIRNLRVLTICNCNKLVMLPSSLFESQQLDGLYIYLCSGLVELPISVRVQKKLRRIILAQYYHLALKSIRDPVIKCLELRMLFISLFGHEKFECRTVSSRQVHMMKLLQHFLRTCIQCDFHQRDYFYIFFPKVRIPELFDYQSINQKKISIDLNPSWYTDKFMGFSICCCPNGVNVRLVATLICKSDPERKHSLKYDNYNHWSMISSDNMCYIYIPFETLWHASDYKEGKNPSDYCLFEVSSVLGEEACWGIRLEYEHKNPEVDQEITAVQVERESQNVEQIREKIEEASIQSDIQNKEDVMMEKLLNIRAKCDCASSFASLANGGGPQRSEGPALVLAIGTATPSHWIDQNSYPDYYFRVTNSAHLVDLKDKFRRICSRTMIKKRHMILTEEILKKNPNLCSYSESSLDIRQEILVSEIPKLGKEAALKAIEEWAQPKPFSSTSEQGCFAGGTMLRLAKDLAENNKGARILVVCAESFAIGFRGPNESHIDNLVAQALFGDGAAAIVIGSDPKPGLEKPVFEIVSAAQTFIPNGDCHLASHFREMGLTFHCTKGVPPTIAKNVESCLTKALGPLGISDWNSLFWILHPGGNAIVDQVENNLGLEPEKLRATRNILRDFGNMSSACVLFILDEIRKKSARHGLKTTGEGLDLGVLLSLGLGLLLRQ
ncbi:hypothetical protein HAX54_023576 [Datura stramonium]|uniref:chalcone synthase n=1 Tax=Datura stramonium TaxID=4076 RepID=A0ABS8UWQ7_DATST|nr:hypothetical protein [Datura stramonium]